MRANSILLAFFLMIMTSTAHAQGTLRGRVVFEGTPSPAEKIEVKSDVPVCGTHQEVQKIILGADQGVANAVVRVLGTAGKMEPKKGHLDQVNCQFVPHIQALPTGSTLTITSSDSVLHNAHAFNEDGSTAFNVAVPIVGMEVNKKLSKPGVLKLRCDAGHTWMSGYIVVLDEPHAVTDANGNFAIEGIPSGKYEIEVWQEWLGKSKQAVDVKEGVSEVNITLKEPKL